MTHAHAPRPSVAINTDFCGSTGGHNEGERGREEEGKMRDGEGERNKRDGQERQQWVAVRGVESQLA